MTKLRLEVNKKYRDRLGNVVTITQKGHTARTFHDTPFIGCFVNGSGQFYASDGRSSLPGTENPRDLVEEVKEGTIMSVQLTVGGTYKNRLEDLIKIVSINTTKRLYRFVDEAGQHYNAAGRQQNTKTRNNDLMSEATTEPDSLVSGFLKTLDDVFTKGAEIPSVLITPHKSDAEETFIPKSLLSTSAVLNLFASHNQTPKRRRVTVGVVGAVCVVLSTLAIFQTRKTRSKCVTPYLKTLRNILKDY